MNRSECLTEQEIMRCVADSGTMTGQHLAALERQKWARAMSERNAAWKSNPAVAPISLAETTTSHSTGMRLSRWLGARLVSAGHRLEGSAT
jgi:hypothetical protein